MNKPLILVVEDDPSVRNLITTTLKTNDYRYVAAPNGSAAIMEATSHNPEIILLDLGLPDMDGVQVIQTARSWSNVPIIVVMPYPVVIVIQAGAAQISRSGHGRATCAPADHLRFQMINRHILFTSFFHFLFLFRKRENDPKLSFGS